MCAAWQSPAPCGLLAYWFILQQVCDFYVAYTFGRLKDRVFSERGFRTATKILVYKAVILTTLLYGCETWVAYRRHVKVLEQFQQRILRAILGVHWQDRITNARILEQADTTSIEAHIVMSDACQTPEYRNSYCTPSFHRGSGKLADSGNATKTN